MGSISADELSWNAKKQLTETALTESSIEFDVDGAPDSDYLLLIRNSTSNDYTGSVKAGDFWMEGQGDIVFEVTSDETDDYVAGPFESGRVMRSDSSFEVTFSHASAVSDLSVSLLEIPKG